MVAVEAGSAGSRLIGGGAASALWVSGEGVSGVLGMMRGLVVLNGLREFAARPPGR